jgi:acylphosphatase
MRSRYRVAIEMTQLHSDLTAPGGSYSTDVEAGTPTTVRIRIVGRFSDDYLGFVASRAQWLSLSGWARNLGPGRAEVVAAGPQALVGALEMACVLGPLDTLVERCDSEPANESVTAGFIVRG